MNERVPLAWVAGARGGIGSTSANRLEDKGFFVHRSDRPDEDLTMPGVSKTIAEKLRNRGGVDAAVFAIGMSGRSFGDGSLLDCTEAAWSTLLEVNLTTAFRFLKVCLAEANDGASIVLIGSALSGRIDADFHTAAYKVSKSALHSLAELGAFEGAARGIRVNLVNPGLVDTLMATRALTNPAIQERFSELMPLTAHPASAETVADAVEWLISPQSAHTTGTVIPVDGGWLL